MILFLPSEYFLNLDFHITIACVAEETTHLSSNRINHPSLSREKHRRIPAIRAKQFLHWSLSSWKSRFATTLTLTIRFTIQKHSHSIFELKHFISSNRENDHIDFVIWFTPLMSLWIQSNSQNSKLLSSQLLPEFGNHWVSESRRCPQMTALR
jgi:hypothetical protein